MAETTKQRTERIIGMSRAQLVMHCQELERQRDLAVEALEWATERIEPAATKEFESENDCACPVCRAISTIKESEGK